MTVEIPLTRGLVALVDDEDAELISRFNWTTAPGHRTYYAQRRVPRGHMIKGYRRHQGMHQLIFGDWFFDGHIDHINGNGLDNRKENLRLVTVGQNHFNLRRHIDGSSIYKGVRWVADRKRWRAAIQGDMFPKRHKSLGSYVNEEDAAQAYDEAARKYFGPYAAVNFPLPGERSALTEGGD